VLVDVSGGGLVVSGGLLSGAVVGPDGVAMPGETLVVGGALSAVS
jgi:hypothetical protein